MKSPFPPGCAARFESRRLLGTGGFGSVYLAYQTSLERLVAIKLLNAQGMESPEMIERFLREARVTSSIAHPHVVVVVDHDVEDGVPWIAYEYLEGPALSARLAKGPLPLEDCLVITGQVASALEAAHALGVLHRDIKPDNLLEHGPQTVKVADFGIAKWGGGAGVRTAAGFVMGTPAYLAPEVIKGGEPSSAGDVYALGVTLYELATGSVPFQAPGVMDVLRMHIEGDRPRPGARDPRLMVLDPLVFAMMAVSPAARPSPRAVIEQVDALLHRLLPRDWASPPAWRAAVAAPAPRAVTAGASPTARVRMRSGADRARPADVPPPAGRGRVAGGLLVLAVVLAAILFHGHWPAKVPADPGAPPASSAPVVALPTMAELDQLRERGTRAAFGLLPVADLVRAGKGADAAQLLAGPVAELETCRASIARFEESVRAYRASPAADRDVAVRVESDVAVSRIVYQTMERRVAVLRAALRAGGHAVSLLLIDDAFTADERATVDAALACIGRELQLDGRAPANFTGGVLRYVYLAGFALRGETWGQPASGQHWPALPALDELFAAAGPALSPVARAWWNLGAAANRFPETPAELAPVLAALDRLVAGGGAGAQFARSGLISYLITAPDQIASRILHRLPGPGAPIAQVIALDDAELARLAPLEKLQTERTALLAAYPAQTAECRAILAMGRQVALLHRAAPGARPSPAVLPRVVEAVALVRASRRAVTPLNGDSAAALMRVMYSLCRLADQLDAAFPGFRTAAETRAALRPPTSADDVAAFAVAVFDPEGTSHDPPVVCEFLDLLSEMSRAAPSTNGALDAWANPVLGRLRQLAAEEINGRAHLAEALRDLVLLMPGAGELEARAQRAEAALASDPAVTRFLIARYGSLEAIPSEYAEVLMSIAMRAALFRMDAAFWRRCAELAGTGIVDLAGALHHEHPLTKEEMEALGEFFHATRIGLECAVRRHPAHAGMISSGIVQLQELAQECHLFTGAHGDRGIPRVALERLRASADAKDPAEALMAEIERGYWDLGWARAFKSRTGNQLRPLLAGLDRLFALRPELPADLEFLRESIKRSLAEEAQ